MNFARLIGILSTIILVPIVLVTPGLVIMAFLGGYKGLLLALLIGTLSITTLYVQKEARYSIETASPFKIWPSLVIFMIHVACILYVDIAMQFEH